MRRKEVCGIQGEVKAKPKLEAEEVGKLVVLSTIPRSCPFVSLALTEWVLFRRQGLRYAVPASNLICSLR